MRDAATTINTLVVLAATSRNSPLARTRARNAAMKACKLMHSHEVRVGPADLCEEWTRVELARLRSEVEQLRELISATKKVPKKCPSCGMTTRIAVGMHGKFAGCMGYFNQPPDEQCRWTQPLPE